MKVKVAKLNLDAVIPQYAKEGDAGLDLTAISKEQDSYGNIVYGTGLAFEIPEGHVGLLFPRSSNAKKDLYLTNHVGVIDSGYRGEVILKYAPDSKAYTRDSGDENFYEIGERIGQLIIIPIPHIELEEATELNATLRGLGGFGSTGN